MFGYNKTRSISLICPASFVLLTIVRFFLYKVPCLKYDIIIKQTLDIVTFHLVKAFTSLNWQHSINIWYSFQLAWDVQAGKIKSECHHSDAPHALHVLD